MTIRRKKKPCAHLYLSMQITYLKDGRVKAGWACNRCKKAFGKPQYLTGEQARVGMITSMPLPQPPRGSTTSKADFEAFSGSVPKTNRAARHQVASEKPSRDR